MPSANIHRSPDPFDTYMHSGVLHWYTGDTTCNSSGLANLPVVMSRANVDLSAIMTKRFPHTKQNTTRPIFPMAGGIR